jgi:D-alanine-D-alanine ligase
VKIGIAFDLAPTDPAFPGEGPDDRFEEFDKPETVEAIAEVIQGEGHEVVLLGDGREFLTRVLADPPDFVFNIAEGEGVGRCREARVPSVLEMLGIPYSGSDPLTLAACLDKDIARRLVTGFGVAIPLGAKMLPIEPKEVDRPIFLGSLYEVFEPDDPGGPIDLASRPLILKPAFEGSSKGILQANVVRSEEELIEAWRRLCLNYRQPILIEEFIEGDEVTVGLVGNLTVEGKDTVEVLGSMRVVPQEPTGAFVYSLAVKRDWANRVRYEFPEMLTDRGLLDLEIAAKLVYGRLGCRDVARIDFRVRDGVPYFIEANPLPGLAPGSSDLVILARGHGIEYPDLIRKILHAALTRVGLK